ncbi:hypothetical protein AgCh_012260 [Apium graveolens]
MCKSQVVSIKTLENQIGQITNAFLNRQPGTLPSYTEVPGKRKAKEQVKAITLRSGKIVNPEQTQVLTEEAGAEKEVEQQEVEVKPRKTTVEHTPPEGNIGEKQIYPPPPFPKRLQKKKLDKQFEKFLEVFKKLHINIPFTKALEQMPTRHHKWPIATPSMSPLMDLELQTFDFRHHCVLNAELHSAYALLSWCSYSNGNTLLQYANHGNCSWRSASIDTGTYTGIQHVHKLAWKIASVAMGVPTALVNDDGKFSPSYANFMKGILSRKVKLDDLETVALTEECCVVVQQKLPSKLKDPGSFTIPYRSITYPRGIVEDFLVKVDKLIFPADFVILDFEEDKKIPIILGRPFLATGRTLIDVQKDSEDDEGEEQLQYLNASPWKRKIDMPFESLGNEELNKAPKRLKPSIKEAPTLELKPLPEHLRYAFLGDASTFPIIITSDLSGSDEEKLLRILREFKSVIGWTIADIKGISPSYYMHKILLEEGSNPTVE